MKKFEEHPHIFNPFYRNLFLNWLDAFKRNFNYKSRNYEEFLENSRKGNNTTKKGNYVAFEDIEKDVDVFNRTSDNIDKISMDASLEGDIEEAADKKGGLRDNNERAEEFRDEIYIPKDDGGFSEREEYSEGEDIEEGKTTKKKQILKEKVIQPKESNSDTRSKSESFLFLENLEIDFRKKFLNCKFEPVFSIFNVRCPERERKLNRLFESMGRQGFDPKRNE